MIGTVELLFVICLWGIVTTVYFLSARFRMTAIAFAVCMTVSAVITPADMFSCLLVGGILFVTYLTGLRIGRIPTSSPA